MGNGSFAIIMVVSLKKRYCCIRGKWANLSIRTMPCNKNHPNGFWRFGTCHVSETQWWPFLPAQASATDFCGICWGFSGDWNHVFSSGNATARKGQWNFKKLLRQPLANNLGVQFQLRSGKRKSQTMPTLDYIMTVIYNPSLWWL